MPDKISLDVLLFLAARHGVPKEIVAAVVERMLPSIRLVPTPGPSPVGGCRVGGAPDLPAGVPWPRFGEAWGEGPDFFEAEGMPNTPLPFLMQINLAETARFPASAELPKSGMLYFFWLHEDWDEQTAYILHTDEPPVTASIVPDDLDREQLFRGVALAPRHEWTIDLGRPPSPYGVTDFPFYPYFAELESHMAESRGLDSPKSGGGCHRLLGHPALIQSPGLAEGTRLLAQIDSDPSRTGMRFGDCGCVYFLINETRLQDGLLARSPRALWETC